MKYEELRGKVKKDDLVEIRTIFSDELNKYVIVSMLKDMFVILPILEDSDLAAACPVLSIPYSMISNVNKLDNYMLLFYAGLNNKYIDRAIIGNIPRRTKHAKVSIPVR